MQVKLADIAVASGLSITAVSMALRDHPRVSKSTQDRIKLLAKEMGYEVNAHGRGLVTARSGTIGVIVPNEASVDWPFYYLDSLVRDIRRLASKAGFDTLLADVDNRCDSHSGLFRSVLQQKVDGLIVISTGLDPVERKVLASRKFPLAMVHAVPEILSGDPMNEFSCFFSDNIAGGRLAGEYLLRIGCRRLLCLANSIETPEMRDRKAGFVEVISATGESPSFLYCDSGFQAVCDLVEKNLDLLTKQDGIFCHTDIMACALIQSLQKHGISIPKDIRVVGYDDIEMGTYWQPKLTTIHQPRREMVTQACANLVSWIRSPETTTVQHSTFPPRLIVRESA